jgi:hypothetical protein
MKPQAAESDNRYGRLSANRFNLALFVVVELLCTGAFVAWVLL